MFTDHLEYLGLTPAEIATATETTDGLTTYYTIDNANVNDLEALYNQFLLALDIAPPNVTTDASATAATDLATSASSAFANGLDPSSAADLASTLDPATAVDPSIFADLLSSIGL
jgi:hypothetical protein